MGGVDNDGVGVGNVNARLDDIGTHQHVKFALNKTQHGFFELVAFHLAVRHANARLWHEFHDDIANGLNVIDAIVDKKHLPATVEFVADGIADKHLVENVYFGADGLAVGRRRVDNRQIARAHEREVQRARDRRGRKRQYVNVEFYFL